MCFSGQIFNIAKVLMILTTKIQRTWLISKLRNKHLKNMLAFFGYLGEQIMPTCFLNVFFNSHYLTIYKETSYLKAF
jgi:hypothetical protein